MKLNMKLLSAILLVFTLFLFVPVSGMKNPDSLFARRQEIARQIQELKSEGAALTTRSRAGKLNQELLMTDSLLIYNYLLDYARKNKKLDDEVKKQSGENEMLKSNIGIHKNLIIEREKTLKYLLASIFVMIILLSVFISLYIERYRRVLKLAKLIQKSDSESKSLLKRLEEKEARVRDLEKIDIQLKDDYIKREKELSDELSRLKNENRDMILRSDELRNTFTRELHELLLKLRGRK